MVVDAVIVLSLFLLLAVVVVEVGRYLVVWHGVHTAAAEAARRGSWDGDQMGGEPAYADCVAIANAALVMSGLAEVDASQVRVEYQDRTGDEIHDCDEGNPEGATMAPAERIVVTVSGGYRPIVPVVGNLLGTRTVSAVDVITVEGP